MPTWAFVSFLAAVAIVTWFAYFRPSWWSFISVGLLVAVPLLIRRKRWTAAPDWFERVGEPIKRAEPTFWAVMGWVVLVFGVFFMIAAPIGLIFGLVSGDRSLAIGNLLVILLAPGVIWSGRWLTRNRRAPFSPPPDST